MTDVTNYDEETENDMPHTDTVSLYDMLVDATSMEILPDESPEDYKMRLVEALTDMEEDDYESLPLEVRDWRDDATAVANKNKKSKNKSFLTVIPGLPIEDPAVAAAAAAVAEKKPRGRPAKVKAAKEPKAPREKKEKVVKEKKVRDPRANRYYRIMSSVVGGSLPTTTEELESLCGVVNEAHGSTYDVATVRYAVEAYRNAKLVFEDHELLK